MKRWFNSAWYACKGTVLFFRTEANGKLELVIALATLALSIWLRLSVWEYCLVILCLGLIIMAEMFNTAIERLADFITREHHTEIGAVKDIAAAGVMMSCIASGVVALLIFGPKIVVKFAYMF